MARVWRWIVLFAASIGGLIFFRLLNHLEVIGELKSYRRPNESARIYYANHISWFDPTAILFGCLLRPLQCFFSTNPRVWSVAYAGQLCGWRKHLIQPARIIAHQNWMPDIDRKIIAVIEQGEDLLIFPEGRRHRGRNHDDLAPFRRGLAWIAKNCNVELVPVAVIGAEKMLTPESRLPRIGQRIRIIFGQPIPSAAFNGKGIREINADLEERLKTLLRATS